MDFNAMLQAQQEEAIKADAFTAKPKYEVDERFYVLSKDANGCSNVKVRFVPSFNADKTKLQMYVTQKYHTVNWNRIPLDEKSEKKYWAGVCPTTIKGKECTICNHGFTEGAKIPKVSVAKGEPIPKDQLLRSEYYKQFCSSDRIITNVMILKDDVNPDNVGKVFLFELKTSLFKMIATEAEVVQKRLAEFPNAQDRVARGIPADLKGFDPYNLLASKDLNIVYKSKKFTNNDPKAYWGSSNWDDIFTAKVNNADEYKEIVEQAYVLDEFLSEDCIPDEEFLEKKLAELTFSNITTNVVKEQPKQEAPKVQVETPVAPTVAQEVIKADDIDAILNSAPKVQQEAPKMEQPKVVNPIADMSDDDLINSILNGN